MVRPRCCKQVGGMPAADCFKPAGVPRSALEEVVLAVEEFEAIRLADLDGLYQEDAARKMDISRATFGRLVETARHKVAEALVCGKMLRIEGGAFCCGASGGQRGCRRRGGRRCENRESRKEDT